MDEIKVTDLFDLSHTRARGMLAEVTYPWEALDRIGETVLAIGSTLDPNVYEQVKDGVWIAKSASIAPTASIAAPILIRGFYYIQIEPLGIMEDTGLSMGQIRQAYDEMMDFCMNRTPCSPPANWPGASGVAATSWTCAGSSA